MNYAEEERYRFASMSLVFIMDWLECAAMHIKRQPLDEQKMLIIAAATSVS